MRTEKKRISIFLKDYVSRKCELDPTKKIDCFCITIYNSYERYIKGSIV